MASINDLTLARKLTDRVAEACAGLESGSAAILDQVSPTTAELLKWWFQEDFKDTRSFNFHDGQRAGILNVIYAHEVLGMTTLKGLYQEIAPEVLIASDQAAQIISVLMLREGFDVNNICVIVPLRASTAGILLEQTIGRGLRLSVNQNGDRMDHPATVHEINVLTVVASESYKNFVANLQEEISDALSARPRKADEAYFTGKIIKTETGTLQVTPALAKQIYKYLLKNDYTDESDQIAEAYHAAKKEQKLAALPEELAPHAEQVFLLIDSVFSVGQLPQIGDDHKPKTNPLNSNFEKKEFQELWGIINRKAVYRVEFDSAELIKNCIKTLNKELRVSPLQYTIQTGIQEDQITDSQLKAGESFQVQNTVTEAHNASIHSSVKYDLLGKIAENVQLTRKTVAEIFRGMETPVFGQFKRNPEHFIVEASRLIKEQKATIIIERLSYDEVAVSL